MKLAFKLFLLLFVCLLCSVNSVTASHVCCIPAELHNQPSPCTFDARTCDPVQSVNVAEMKQRNAAL